MNVTTFRLDSKYLGSSDTARDMQDQAYHIWRKCVEQKMVAFNSAFDLDSSVLREDLQDWFDQYEARYRLSMRFAYRDGIEKPEQDWGGMECVTEIDVFDGEVALLFKLTWIAI